MKRIIIQILESFRAATTAISSNLFRALLSLLSISIGVFSIICALTIVDSLKHSITTRLSTSFGSRTLYVTRMPWVFDSETPWWEFIRRPNIKYREYTRLENSLNEAEAISIIAGRDNVNAKKGNNSSKSRLTGISYQYNQITELDIAEGRYFTEFECHNGTNVAIIGSKIYDDLFPQGLSENNNRIKVRGLYYTVIGVIKKKGKDLLDFGYEPDTEIYLPYKSFIKIFPSSFMSPNIMAKAKESDEGELLLESEIEGLMRTIRGFKPSQQNNFSINRPDALNNALEPVFTALTMTGWIISIFSILIGAIGIVNIMFVSVLERTQIIGIQKSLGAKNYFILFQFLFESIILSLLGGGLGLLLVLLVVLFPQEAMALVLTNRNILIGLTLSLVVGVVAGIVPAIRASQMNPIAAMRKN